MTTDTADLLGLIRAERQAFLALLETLTPEEWATPSLCAAWRVQDVAAHLAQAPAAGPGEAFVGFVRAGFRPNRANADAARRWSRRGTAAILERLRHNLDVDAKPLVVPRIAALADAVVHGLDVRRPLGRPAEVSPESFRLLADWMVGLGWPATMMIGGSVRRRIAGLRLLVPAADWSYGSGPAVEAAPDTVLLLLNGRPVDPAELTGPGATLLASRLPRR